MNKKSLLIGLGVYLILKGIVSLTQVGSLISQSTSNGMAMLLLGGMGIYISLKRENVLGRSLVIYGAFLIWSGVSAFLPGTAFGYEPVWLAALEIVIGLAGIIFGIKPQPAP
jgi:hypothetical protein